MSTPLLLFSIFLFLGLASSETCTGSEDATCNDGMDTMSLLQGASHVGLLSERAADDKAKQGTTASGVTHTSSPKQEAPSKASPLKSSSTLVEVSSDSSLWARVVEEFKGKQKSISDSWAVVGLKTRSSVMVFLMMVLLCGVFFCCMAFLCPFLKGEKRNEDQRPVGAMTPVMQHVSALPKSWPVPNRSPQQPAAFPGRPVPSLALSSETPMSGRHISKLSLSAFSDMGGPDAAWTAPDSLDRLTEQAPAPLSAVAPPPLCPRLVMPACEVRMGMPTRELAELGTSTGEMRIMGLSGNLLLRAGIQINEQKQRYLLISMPERNSAPRALVVPAGNGRFDIRGMKGSFYGTLEMKSSGDCYVIKDGATVLLLGGDSDSLQLHIKSGSGAPIASVRNSATDESFGGVEHAEFRVEPGMDTVLVVAVVLAALLLSPVRS